MEQHYKESARTPKLREPGSRVIVCHRSDYTKRKGLGAHVVDATPIRGDYLFRVDSNEYDAYKNCVECGMVNAALEHFYKIREILKEKARQHPVNWILPLRNPNIVFIDNCRDPNKPASLMYPREIAAEFYIEQMTTEGYTLELNTSA